MPIGNKIKNGNDLYLSFIKGYPLDFSTSTMLVLIPMLVALIYYVFHKEGIKNALPKVIGTLLILYIAVSLSDAGLYREWNAKINMQALEHFQNPSEVLKTISVKLLIIYFVLLAGLTYFFLFIYKKFVQPIISNEQSTSIKKRIAYGLLFFIVSGGLAIIVIRGGITNMPINQSIAYFSNDILANDIAVNPLYSLIQDLDIKNKIPDSTVYKLRSNEEAQAIIADDFTLVNDSSLKILNTTRPNLVYIFLESWSVDNISRLGGIDGCTPQFNKLCDEGLLFTNAYSNAYVSDQGIPAVLSAYPSVSRMAISNQPAKIHNLPCISEELEPLGYSRSFLFGGELVYGNLRGYLLEKKFTDLTEVYDLTQYPKGKLGVQDEYTFNELTIKLNQKKEPFLYGFFTQSTHMPYDFSPSDNWQSAKNDPEKKYTESIHYADIHLGKFFEQAKKQAWYANTLFIVVADHSHNTIKQWDPVSPQRSKIPMLFIGGALSNEWKGKSWDKIVSQLDITSTILHQMNLPSSRYPWSRDMMNPSKPSSAYYVYYGGAGYINESGFASASLQNKSLITTDQKDSSIIEKMNSKLTSFEQLVYEDVRTRK
jgi:phosphoglycerol transferase MdoB-like AlkP superfamily enzyme